ncbi:MAG TPA: DNA-directed RNA polymerase subunit alpha [Thermoanaerobaculia bacterium]|jgi:DNA-directed RNA polymerase subunit alpha|nr:DNA-directed RNA polymerase subunit alpha [Thermoanaerobaculia bacterium]
MLWKGFQRPKRVEVDTETLTGTYGRFTAQPFERGFATTIGNALRRCLLSSIEGAAITAVNIEGVLHEFSSVPGVQEDVTDIILNLKQMAITLHSEDSKVLSIDIQGPGTVTAGHMNEDPQVEIFDPSVHLATVNEEGRLKLQAQIKKGRGYVSADRNFDESMGIGWIPVDSAHSPVRRVNYRVEAARLGQTTDYERLILEVWTNGTVRPEEAVSLASMLLKDHLGIFIQTEESLRHDGGELGREELAGLDALLAKNIDELDLSVRSANSLKNANIHTLRDLVRRTEKDMLETKNFGKKSLEEVQEVLDRLGLSLGMDVPERSSGVGASA